MFIIFFRFLQESRRELFIKISEIQQYIFCSYLHLLADNRNCIHCVPLYISQKTILLAYLLILERKKNFTNGTYHKKV